MIFKTASTAIGDSYYELVDITLEERAVLTQVISASLSFKSTVLEIS